MKIAKPLSRVLIQIWSQTLWEQSITACHMLPGVLLCPWGAGLGFGVLLHPWGGGVEFVRVGRWSRRAGRMGAADWCHLRVFLKCWDTSSVSYTAVFWCLAAISWIAHGVVRDQGQRHQELLGASWKCRVLGPIGKGDTHVLKHFCSARAQEVAPGEVHMGWTPVEISEQPHLLAFWGQRTATLCLGSRGLGLQRRLALATVHGCHSAVVQFLVSSPVK